MQFHQPKNRTNDYQENITPLPMPQSIINKMEDMAIKEDRDEDLIFTDGNGSSLEVYKNDSNAHDVTAGVDNKYDNYNSNNADYGNGTNDK